MKKIKLLTSVLGLTTLSTMVMPMVGCSCSKENPIPTDLLNIEGTTLKGLKDGVDISKYNTLSIPSNVEIIGEGAFKGVFTALNKISKVVISNSVTTIKASAFEYCYGVSVFDFSSFTRGQINGIAIENNAFGDIKSEYVWYANIVFGSEWKDETITTDGFKTKLREAGVPDYWFVQATTGHIEYDNQTEQSCTSGAGYIRMNLLEEHVEGRVYIPVVSKVDGTSGVGIKCDDEASMIDKKLMRFNSQMVFPATYTPQNGDWVSYKVTVFCTVGTDVKWVQTVQVYKSVYKTAPTVAVKSIYFESPSMSMKVNETKTPVVKINPDNATEQGYSLTTSDPSIAIIENGQIKALKAGTCTITATSVDGGHKGNCTLTVTNN